MVKPLVAAGLMPRSGLDAICEFFGIGKKDRHTAMGGVELTIRAYRRILEFYAPSVVAELRRRTAAAEIDSAMRSAEVPSHHERT